LGASILIKNYMTQKFNTFVDEKPDKPLQKDPHPKLLKEKFYPMLNGLRQNAIEIGL